jgi:hypothetical protein
MCGLGKLVRSAALATFAVGAGLAQAAPEAPTAPGGGNAAAASAPVTPIAPSVGDNVRRHARLVAPVMAPLAIPPQARVSYKLPAKTAEVAAVPETVVTGSSDAVKALAAAAAISSAQDAAAQSSTQLDKFQQVYEDATKIFGSEHTVISPSLFVANDIKGRLSATDKRQTGVAGTLMLPLIGIGGGHGRFDWWPVLVTSDETQIYQSFLTQLDQYQQAESNIIALGGNIDAIAHTKWNVQNLLLAKQLFCQEEVDPELPPAGQDVIKKLCSDPTFTTITPTTTTTTNSDNTTSQVTTINPTADQQTVIDAVSMGAKSGAVKLERHNFLIGPSLGIPITQNPTDIFQFGASAEIGDEEFRIMASGGLVGRYQGANFKDVLAAGWFVGVALSGQIGDELFHYFNGGSNLLTQLAQIKNNPPVAPQ